MSSGVSIEGERESGQDVRASNGNSLMIYSESSYVSCQHCEVFPRSSRFGQDDRR